MRSSPSFRGIAAGILVFVAAISSTLGGVGIITLPPGLNPGDQYRLAFVTDGRTNPLSPNIIDYNNFVAAEAAAIPALAGLNVVWTAIGSTITLDARDNTGTNPGVNGAGVPIFRLDGAKVADDNSDLWDSSLDASVSISPTGQVAGNIGSTVSLLAWTGTQGDGTKIVTREFGSADDFFTVGFVAGTTSNWMVTNNVPSSNGPYALYGISGVITVVPEPSSGLLVALAAGMLLLRRRK